MELRWTLWKVLKRNKGVFIDDLFFCFRLKNRMFLFYIHVTYSIFWLRKQCSEGEKKKNRARQLWSYCYRNYHKFCKANSCYWIILYLWSGLTVCENGWRSYDLGWLEAGPATFNEVKPKFVVMLRAMKMM